MVQAAIDEPKTQVLAAMGAPSGSKAVAFTAGQDAIEWDYGNDIFLATFTGGNASNLQAYAGSVGPSGATDIPCAAFRSH